MRVVALALLFVASLGLMACGIRVEDEMHLVAPLASGVAGAASGSATIRRRGTSTNATYYTTAEAASQNTTGTVALDQNGGAVIYVNEPVDIVVRDVNGSTVRSFTVMDTATETEVISPSFTGTDYVTAATGANKPVQLSTVLDRWETSAGAPDFMVNVDGSDTTIENAIGALAGVFFNVKSPEFGAIGDGIANDRAAINAAQSAAQAAGGIVYFPPGTYGFSGGSLNASDNVTWTFSDGAALKPLASSASALIAVSHVSGGSSFRLNGARIRVPNTLSITGALMTVASSANIEMDNVRATGTDDSATTSGLLGNGIVFSGAAEMSARGASILLSGTASETIVRAGVTSLYLDQCSFVIRNATTWTGNVVEWDGGSITNSELTVDSPSITAGRAILFNTLAFATTVTGNTVKGTSDTLTVGIDGESLATTDLVPMHLASNTYSGCDNNISVDNAYRAGRNSDRIVLRTSTSATSLSVDVSLYDRIYIERTGASGALAVTFSNAGFMLNGSDVEVVMFNATGGNVTLSFSAANIRSLYPSGTPLTVATLTAASIRFRAIEMGAGPVVMLQMGAAANGF